MRSLKEILKSLEGLSDIELFVIDLFCGAGGLSEGVEQATIDGQKCAKVVCCVNHDTNAILSHNANMPDVLHFIEDIRTLELSPIKEIVDCIRELYPDAKIMLHASLECTNFSKAKGGQPRDADSRTLAEHLFRYIDVIVPDYIQIENVEEFMSWGPMDENGKPISMRKGEDYIRWVYKIKHGYGKHADKMHPDVYDMWFDEMVEKGSLNKVYNFDYRILNAADFGAYTSRKRFFGIFAKIGLPIVFPEPTHCKEGKQDMFTCLEKWKPVKDVLDFEDEGTSIFTRKKPLSEKTLERIYAGLIKFVAGGKDKWLLKYNSINGKTGKHIPPGIDEPCPTVSCQGRLGVVQAHFLSRYNTCRPQDTCKSVEDPCGVLTTNNRFAKVGCQFLSKYFSGHPESKNIPVSGPAHTIKYKDNHSLINAKFLSAYYGNGDNVSQVDKPCPTVPTKDRFNYVSPKFLDMQYGNGTAVSIDIPAGTVTTSPKHNLVTCRPWVMNTNFCNIGSQIDAPAPVITANRKWHYLMNPQFMSAGGNIDNPCFTLIARMDKMPPYLVCTKEGEVIIQVYETDSPMTRKIKEFMAAYGMVDILMRMLKIPELKRIMGFPEDYVLIGTQADQKKFIGNAVEVTQAKKNTEALCRKLRIIRLRKQKEIAA